MTTKTAPEPQSPGPRDALTYLQLRTAAVRLHEQALAAGGPLGRSYAAWQLIGDLDKLADITLAGTDARPRSR